MGTEATEPLSVAGRERLADIIVGLNRSFLTRLTARLNPGQVSFPQYILLSHVNGCPHLSMTEIAETMDHTTAAATGLVDRLAKLGYVRREIAENDRRKVLVSITPKGIELVNQVRQEIFDSLSTVMENLTPDEQHMWLQIYNKIFDYCRNNCPNKHAPKHS